MKLLYNFLTGVSILLSSSQSYGQDLNGSSLDKTPNSFSEVHSIKITGLDPFSDFDDRTAKSLSAQNNISLESARLLLFKQNAASHLAQKIININPDLFSSMYVKNGKYIFRLVGAGSNSLLNSVIGGISNDKFGMNDVVFEQAMISERERTQNAQNIISLLKSVGINAVVSTDTVTDAVTIQVPDINLLKQFQATGKLVLPNNVKIEQSEGIILTAQKIQWSGGQFFNSSEESCTTGFNAQDGSSNLFGPTTAGHCKGGSTAVIDISETGTYSRPSVYSTSVQLGSASSSLDIAIYHYTAGAPTNSAKDCAWDGGTCIRVKGTQPVYSGMYICKYGRT
ncbi:MAG: hypothetical protein EOP45_15720, partial [Sphingobacteriaceae bacterium]